MDFQTKSYMNAAVKKIEDAITDAASDIESAINDVETRQGVLEEKLDAILESLKRRQHRDVRGDNVCVFCGETAPCACPFGG